MTTTLFADIGGRLAAIAIISIAVAGGSPAPASADPSDDCAQTPTSDCALPPADDSVLPPTYYDAPAQTTPNNDDGYYNDFPWSPTYSGNDPMYVPGSPGY